MPAAGSQIAHRSTAAVSLSIRPERKRITRSQRAAKRWVMRHQDQRGVALFMAGEQQFDDLLAGALVEISGGLVGDENRGIGRQRARQRHALLLAAGKLRGIMRKPVGQSDLRQLALRAFIGIGRAREFQRHGDILDRRHGRDQMEGLEHDADMAAAKPRQAVLVELAEIGTGDLDRTGVRPLKPCHHHQQGRFARAGRADQPDGLAAADLQSYILENVNPRRAAAEREIDPGERDRCGQRRLGPRDIVHEAIPYHLSGSRKAPRPNPRHMGAARGGSRR